VLVKLLLAGCSEKDSEMEDVGQYAYEGQEWDKDHKEVPC
jgi:major membrane immunogen (membrane-anchored lipoprotein)